MHIRLKIKEISVLLLKEEQLWNGGIIQLHQSLILLLPNFKADLVLRFSRIVAVLL